MSHNYSGEGRIRGWKGRKVHNIGREQSSMRELDTPLRGLTNGRTISVCFWSMWDWIYNLELNPSLWDRGPHRARHHVTACYYMKWLRGQKVQWAGRHGTFDVTKWSAISSTIGTDWLTTVLGFFNIPLRRNIRLWRHVNEGMALQLNIILMNIYLLRRLSREKSAKGYRSLQLLKHLAKIPTISLLAPFIIHRWNYYRSKYSYQYFAIFCWEPIIIPGPSKLWELRCWVAEFHKGTFNCNWIQQQPLRKMQSLWEGAGLVTFPLPCNITTMLPRSLRIPQREIFTTLEEVEPTVSEWNVLLCNLTSKSIMKTRHHYRIGVAKWNQLFVLGLDKLYFGGGCAKSHSHNAC